MGFDRDMMRTGGIMMGCQGYQHTRRRAQEGEERSGDELGLHLEHIDG